MFLTLSFVCIMAEQSEELTDYHLIHSNSLLWCFEKNPILPSWCLFGAITSDNQSLWSSFIAFKIGKSSEGWRWCKCRRQSCSHYCVVTLNRDILASLDFWRTLSVLLERPIIWAYTRDLAQSPMSRLRFRVACSPSRRQTQSAKHTKCKNYLVWGITDRDEMASMLC